MAKDATLSDQFTLRGTWWVPSNPNNRIAGIITYDPACELKLDIDGRLWQGPPRDTVPIIYGETLDGKCCTLLDSFESNHQTNSPGGESSSLLSDYLFIGHQHIDPSKTEYESALFSISDFGGWMYRNPFTNSELVRTQDATKTTVTYIIRHFPYDLLPATIDGC